MECARKKVVFRALSTSPAEKERCSSVLRAMTVRAFNFAVRNGLVGLTRGKQYAELFEPFSHTPGEVLRGLARFVEVGDKKEGEKVAGAAKLAAARVTGRAVSSRGVEAVNGASP